MMEKLYFSNARQIVKINVGGTIFQCYADILKTFLESFLPKLDKEIPNHENGEYYFDRNPVIFAYILDAFRKGSIHLPKDICGNTFKEELEFWEVSSRHVAPCCWEALYKCEDDISTMKRLTDIEGNTNIILMRKTDKTVRSRLWLFFNEPKSSKCALVWAIFISVLIMVSILAEAFSTVPVFGMNYTDFETQTLRNIGMVLNWDNSTYARISAVKRHPYLKLTEILCHIVISLECLISFTLSPQKKHYLLSFVRICTMLGYISFWIAFIMQSAKIFETKSEITVLTAFSYFATLKIARAFYLAKRVPAFSIIGLTLHSSKEVLKILIFIIAILVSMFGILMYVAEYQESNITNIFTGMYFALITVTTVGYGDYVPATPAGHVIAGACAVCGVLILALPIGIVASSFYTFYNYHKYARKHIELTQQKYNCK